MRSPTSHQDLPPIISVVNQKGGVGKTTTVVHLAAALAHLDQRILVIDLDPQANASTTLGLISPYEIKFTSATLILDKSGTLLAPWQPTIEERVSLIYGHISLNRVERELVRVHPAAPGLVLHQRLRQLALEEQNLVFLDCPPTLSLLTVNALAAATHYLIPMESGSRYSLDGYEDLEDLVTDVRVINPNLAPLGVLITRHDGRKNVCRAMRDALARRFDRLLFEAAIPTAAKLQEAEAKKKSIFQMDRQCPPARAFMALGREVLSRLSLPVPASESEDETASSTLEEEYHVTPSPEA
jgi:chromosome partitioning protein